MKLKKGPKLNWKKPNYDAIKAARLKKLQWLEENPAELPKLRTYYKDHIPDFIADWGVTFDPRNRSRGLPTEVPFILFPRQCELLEAIDRVIQAGEPLLVEKSRDCGASWLTVCYAASRCLFDEGLVFGFGSATEDKVDLIGSPDSLLWKARYFLTHLPPEFLNGWNERQNSAHMRLTFPATSSVIIGQGGDNIGRGGRTTAFFIDESAHLERPQKIEGALASNTNSRIDISTPCGRANAFAEKRHSGRVEVFTFRWQDDPRKGAKWYATQKSRLDPVTLAQEVDLSYSASIEGILIPAEWIDSAIGAHEKLGIKPSGERRGALDVADEGKDKNAFIARHGVLVTHAEQWSGAGSDLYQTTVRSMNLTEQLGLNGFDYDADGLGAGVRGDAVQANLRRREAGKQEIDVQPFRGSGAVADPEASMVEGRLNRDYFQNRKAQCWWALRLRFQATHRAVTGKQDIHPDEIISLDRELPELQKLISELTQPTYSQNSVGRIVVDKTPAGAASPNLADALMICFAPLKPAAYFSAATVQQAQPSERALPRFQVTFVFAALSFTEDSGAAVFCAWSRSTRRFWVLDYDLRALGPDAPAWLERTLKRLVELREFLLGNAGRAAILTDGFTGFAQLLLPLREREPSAIRDVSSGSKALPPISERFSRARPLVAMGHVQLCAPAFDKVLTHHGVTRNFLRELLTRTEPVESDPLAAAFSTAVLAAFDGDANLPEPAAPPVPAPESRPWRGFRIALPWRRA